MKKHMLRLTLISLVTLSVFSSCKKDKDDDKLAVTSENLVGSYKLVDYKMKTSATGNVEASLLTDMPACYKDDVYQLKSGGEMIIVDEGVKCDNNETAKWSLTGNTFKLEAGPFSDTYEVISLTKTQLIGSITETEGGVTYTTTLYLTRQ